MITETDSESAKELPARELSASIAVIAGIFGLGLAYLYVGRVRMAFMPLAIYLIVPVVFGWTRLILRPTGLYVVFTIIFCVWLVSIVHPALIARATGEQPAKRFNKGWIYVSWLVGMSLVTSFVAEHRATFFGYEPFRFPASSMAPTIAQGDFVVVDTWRYRTRTPEFGEIIVFDAPAQPGIKYAKRVVGLPGDTIEIRNNVLIRDGQEVAENYTQHLGSNNAYRADFDAMVVPADQYFVLGDNRHNSRDSRVFGAVPENAIHGRVENRWFAYDDGIAWSRFPEDLVPQQIKESGK